MTVALALLLGAWLVGHLVPRWLGRLDLCQVDPTPVIVAWLTSIAAALAAGVGAVIVLLLPNHGVVSDLAVLHHCRTALLHGLPPTLERVSGLLVSGLLLVVGLRITIVGLTEWRRRRRERRGQLAILRLAAEPDSSAANTLWLTHDRPLAFSIAGRPGVVFATKGLIRHLSPDGVGAVIAHERAHLAGRHHLLVAVTELLGKCLPIVPLLRQAPHAIRELVEIAADAHAERLHGSDAVRSALLTVSDDGAPRGALAMARDGIAVRLERLRRHASPDRYAARAARCVLAAVVASTLPLAEVSLLLVTAVVACMDTA